MCLPYELVEYLLGQYALSLQLRISVATLRSNGPLVSGVLLLTAGTRAGLCFPCIHRVCSGGQHCDRGWRERGI